ncbi:hypothetical protein RvY_08309 [Ramazzottius varieornatus]|uniref:Rhodanese domain-containing protein n=1 Tax=Ramazzottius varieornatus TaxID=947166 RepID=A0A1D1VDJ4_RAMVA|nr:hypothetical protein RvY_08309 [Ramazzottius varieornatus]
MNWMQLTDLYNRLNRTWDRTVCLSRPHYMLILDARPKNEYEEGHLPTAKRVVKATDGSWRVTGGWEDITNKETIVVYDMSTSHASPAGLPGPLSEAASFVWRQLKGSRNQSRIYLLNGGFERFTEYYPNCKSYQATYTIGELGKLQVLPLHVPLMMVDLAGKLFYCPADGLAADRVAHMLCDIDAHVNCTPYRDGAFGFAPDEKAYVYRCSIDNQPDMTDGAVTANLKELYNVCHFIHEHLRDERNVLVYGQRGDTMAAAVLVAFLIKYDLLEVEDALRVVKRVHPLAVIDETSRACLEAFRQKLSSDPSCFTKEELTDHGESTPLPSQEPTATIEADNKRSLVASIVKELIPEFDRKKADEARGRSSGFTEADSQIVLNIINEGQREAAAADLLVAPPWKNAPTEQHPAATADGEMVDIVVREDKAVLKEEDGKSRKAGMAVQAVWSATKELSVSRQDIRRFEEETLWKMLHHDRVNPPVFSNVLAVPPTNSLKSQVPLELPRLNEPDSNVILPQSKQPAVDLPDQTSLSQ